MEKRHARNASHFSFRKNSTLIVFNYFYSKSCWCLRRSRFTPSPLITAVVWQCYCEAKNIRVTQFNFLRIVCLFVCLLIFLLPLSFFIQVFYQKFYFYFICILHDHSPLPATRVTNLKATDWLFFTCVFISHNIPNVPLVCVIDSPFSFSALLPAPNSQDRFALLSPYLFAVFKRKSVVGSSVPQAKKRDVIKRGEKTKGRKTLTSFIILDDVLKKK